jgi:hypothetical protein
MAGEKETSKKTERERIYLTRSVFPEFKNQQSSISGNYVPFF